MLKQLGVKLNPIKIVMVNSRLIKRLKATGIYNFKEYLDYALSIQGKRDGELERMVDELTTHKTEFFREVEHFHFLRDIVLPEFVKGQNNLFQIWSAGCSTGEEAYTIAMLLNEFKLANPGFNYSIFASDVSNAVVVKAIRAIYSNRTVEEMDKRFLKRYFLVSRDNNEQKVRVVKELRDKVQFSVQNLVDNYPFQNNSLDVIFCRNTLIYFADSSKKKVVQKLTEKIKPGGYLFVGLSETISQYSTEIKQVSPSVYVKKQG
ncbi:MAG: protein-glutamate O-methyltransferase CheR [Prolixibacteraceae bacterium]|nr:protein-glutamate O-methyltransferase CheR [Prolixibacteraceae bacterium]